MRLLPAFRAGVDTFHAMEQEGGFTDPDAFQERMLQRFLTQPRVATREDMDYLLEKLDRVRDETRRQTNTSTVFEGKVGAA